MDRRHKEGEALIDLRTHLTAAMLAVAQLRRRHGACEDIARLCSSADAAMRRMREDIAAAEAALSPPSCREEPRGVGTSPGT